jgi:N-hydroxyarylamine O-acetyltransferase
VDQYLERIGLAQRPTVDLSGLSTTMAAHLSSVPFENIDVYRQTGVRTDLAWSVPKIVLGKRGGWCFENNGAFGWLLGQLGFRTTYLGAFVLLPPPDTTNMSHLCLRVDIERPYLVDVGFGDAFNIPMPLEHGASVDDGNARHHLAWDGRYWTLFKGVDESEPQYRFAPQPRELDDFTVQSDRLQTPGTSNFTAHPFATRLIDGGPDRVTLLADRIKIRSEGEWTEEAVPPGAWNRLARHWFGLDTAT